MFEAAFMRVALVASIAASRPLSVIGVYLILRRMVFLGLVLANAATVGTAVAHFRVATRDRRHHRRTHHRVAMAFHSLTTPRLWGVHQGVAYAAAASATVLILAGATAADADTLHCSTATCSPSAQVMRPDLSCWRW